MSTALRRLAFAHLDQLQTALINEYDGWPKAPIDVRGHIESLRQLVEQAIPADPTTVTTVADRVVGLVSTLPTELRPQARKVIKRRMMHPETGHVGSLSASGRDIHPRSTGRNYANTVGASMVRGLCAVCHRTPEGHDLDGLNDVCDGYVSEA